MNCKTCSKKCDGDYCFRCKPKKPLMKSTISSFKPFKVKSNKESTVNYLEKRNAFFMTIWKKRKHNCESCNTFLFDEVKSYHFDHVLEKQKYPELAFEEDNIMLLCLECHSNKTNAYYSDLMKERINKVKLLFNK